MDFLELAKKRYSVRDFSSKKVEKEKILKILEAGKIAPTAKNSQLIKIYYCTDDEKLKHMIRMNVGNMKTEFQMELLILQLLQHIWFLKLKI